MKSGLLNIIIITLILLCVNHLAAEKIIKKDANYFYEKGLLAINQDEKIEFLRNAYELDKDNFIINYELGKILIQINNPEGLKYLYRALETDSEELATLTYKELFKYYYSGRKIDYKNANICLQKLVENNKNFRNYYILGILNSHDNLKNYKASIYFLKEALKLKEKNDIIFKIAENYYYLNEYKKSIEWLKKYPNLKQHKEAVKMQVISYYNLYENNKKKYYKITSKKTKDFLNIWKDDKEIKEISDQLKKINKF